MVEAQGIARLDAVMLIECLPLQVISAVFLAKGSLINTRL